MARCSWQTVRKDIVPERRLLRLNRPGSVFGLGCIGHPNPLDLIQWNGIFFYFNETTVARDVLRIKNQRTRRHIDRHMANVNNNFSARSCTIELYTVVLLNKNTHTTRLNWIFFSLLLLWWWTMTVIYELCKEKFISTTHTHVLHKAASIYFHQLNNILVFVYVLFLVHAWTCAFSAINLFAAVVRVIKKSRVEMWVNRISVKMHFFWDIAHTKKAMRLFFYCTLKKINSDYKHGPHWAVRWVSIKMTKKHSASARWIVNKIDTVPAVSSVLNDKYTAGK